MNLENNKYSKVLIYSYPGAAAGGCSPLIKAILGNKPAAGTNFYRDLVGAALIDTDLIGENCSGYITADRRDQIERSVRQSKASIFTF